MLWHKLVRTKLHYRFSFNILRVLIYVTGIVFCLDQIPNFNKAFSALLAGPGIAALTVGLAAQESLGNFINGMVICASKPDVIITYDSAGIRYATGLLAAPSS